MGHRSEALARRIEQGAEQLAAFAETLTDQEWSAPTSHSDARTVGQIVNHVALVYPIEVDLARAVAGGNAVVDVTWPVVADLNAGHAREHAAVTKSAALALLHENSRAAAHAVRTFTDDQLDTAAPFSLSYHAPVTAQFVLEDHAVRHSWHHLFRLKAALGR